MNTTFYIGNALLLEYLLVVLAHNSSHARAFFGLSSADWVPPTQITPGGVTFHFFKT